MAETATKHQIFCFINGKWGDDYVVIAVSDEGYQLAQHVSSSPGWAQRDITAEWKHSIYNAAFPDGWELVWIDDPKTDPRMPKPAKKTTEEELGDR